MVLCDVRYTDGAYGATRRGRNRASSCVFGRVYRRVSYWPTRLLGDVRYWPRAYRCGPTRLLGGVRC
eukprot:1813626-Rhodomonas_salina.1